MCIYLRSAVKLKRASDNAFVIPLRHSFFWNHSVGVNKHGSYIMFSYVRLLARYRSQVAVMSHGHKCVSVSRCVGSNIVLLTQAFQRKFIIPDFEAFSSLINHLYCDAQARQGGKVRHRFSLSLFRNHLGLYKHIYQRMVSVCRCVWLHR